MERNSRIFNSTRNAVFGLLEKIITVLCPFIIRTIILKVLGTEYAGLGSLFTSILSILNFTELGFGSAIIFSMYEPIANGDKDKVCKLLNLYKKFCSVVGFIILIVGLALMPFLDKLINGSYSGAIHIYLLYLMYLFNSVISYFLYAYKVSILTASQRLDVVSKITSCLNMALYITQVFALLIFENYYIYYLFVPIFTVINNLVRSYYIGKMYPDYRCLGKLELSETKALSKKVLALIGFKLNATVILSTDSIVISAFLGLTVLAYYNNYYYILSTLCALLYVLFEAIKPSVGNKLVMCGKDENYKEFNNIVFFFNWVVGWCSICLICLFQPFITLWIGNIFLLDVSTVVLLSVYLYIWKMLDVITLYRDAAGLWTKIIWVPFAGSITNIVLNIVFVNVIGINGIIISTIIAMFIMFPFELKNVFKHCFVTSAKKYIVNMTFYITSIVCVGFICYFACNLVKDTGIFSFALKGIVCVLLPNVLFLLLYSKKSEFKYLIKMLRKIIKQK